MVCIRANNSVEQLSPSQMIRAPVTTVPGVLPIPAGFPVLLLSKGNLFLHQSFDQGIYQLNPTILSGVRITDPHHRYVHTNTSGQTSAQALPPSEQSRGIDQAEFWPTLQAIVARALIVIAWPAKFQNQCSFLRSLFNLDHLLVTRSRLTLRISGRA